jgi:hypothetical protein
LTANVGYTQPFSYDDIVNRCRLQINGQDRFDERYGDYFWKVQPYQHHTGGAFWPMRAQVTSPAALTVTGATCTVTGDVITVTSISGGTAAASAQYIIEGAVVTSSIAGVIAPGTVVSAFGTGSGGAGTYNISEPALVAGTNVDAGTLTFTLPNLQYTPHDNPINVYSFALQPEEHQPSGTCNFSRIDTTTLVFDSIAESGLAKPSKTTPFNFRIYAVNYNIFRVMSGMGGLAYSN